MLKTVNRPTFQYKVLLFLVSPLALGYLIYRALKDGGWRYITQRIGINIPKIADQTIHIHCASVGEVNAVKPIIHEFKKFYPMKSIVVTTNTPTSSELVTNLPYKSMQHCYLPVDLAYAVHQFYKFTNPCISIIVETEIWPNLFYIAKKKNIPLVIINARLSNKTLDTNQLIKNEYQHALKNVDQIFARSEIDREHYISLGAIENNTSILGNLKYAIHAMPNSNLPCTTIKRPFFLAASTHEDEEVQLSEHLQLLKNKNFLLVIAPRYPDRAKRLAQVFTEKGIEVVLRSDNSTINENTDIYIVDTLGELEMYFNEAALVFIGGSLIERGGHNVLEPAKYGKCILVGPYTDNFSLEVKELLAASGIIQVNNNYDLGVQLISLLVNDVNREQFGKNAREFIEEKKIILQDYMNSLRTIIDTKH